MKTRTAVTTLAAVAVLAAAAIVTVVLVRGKDTPPDPKAEWTTAMQTAGFQPRAPHTFDEMFESAKAFCGAGSPLAISGIARTALGPEQAANVAMPAPGKNPDQAASAYGDATWKFACGHR